MSFYNLRTLVNRALISLLALLSISAYAAEPINTLEKSGLFGYNPSGIAIRGADTVAYFTQNKYVAGSDQYVTQWQGATWKFSSQEHLDLFIAEPERYAPQYGGYCAYGVANNSLVKIEPENWTVSDGKLYLNYNAGVHRKWAKNSVKYVEDADTKFEQLLAGD